MGAIPSTQSTLAGFPRMTSIYGYMKSPKLKKIVEEIQHEQYISRKRKLLKVAERITKEMRIIAKQEFGV